MTLEARPLRRPVEAARAARARGRPRARRRSRRRCTDRLPPLGGRSSAARVVRLVASRRRVPARRRANDRTSRRAACVKPLLPERPVQVQRTGRRRLDDASPATTVDRLTARSRASLAPDARRRIEPRVGRRARATRPASRRSCTVGDRREARACAPCCASRRSARQRRSTAARGFALPNDPLLRGSGTWAAITPSTPSTPRASSARCRVAVIDSGIDVGHPDLAAGSPRAKSFVGGDGEPTRTATGPSSRARSPRSRTTAPASPASAARAAPDREGRRAPTARSRRGRGPRDPLGRRQRRARDQPQLRRRARPARTGARRRLLAARAARDRVRRPQGRARRRGGRERRRRADQSRGRTRATRPRSRTCSASLDVRQDGRVPIFSNRDGQYVDIAAPGMDIVSMFPRALTKATPCASTRATRTAARRSTATPRARRSPRRRSRRPPRCSSRASRPAPGPGLASPRDDRRRRDA